MEITWYGLSCFRLIERGMASIVTDPYDSAVIGYEPLKLKADVVTVSHDAPGHNHTDAVRGDRHVLSGAGEYEIGDVFITGIQTSGHDEKPGTRRNTMFVFDYNRLCIAHLGDLDTVPSQSDIEAGGTVHIALVPVGDGSSLNAAKAAEVISLIEPNIVIPMHYATPGCKLQLDPLEKFLKEMGLTEYEEQPSYKTSGPSGLPTETRVVVLQPSGG